MDKQTTHGLQDILGNDLYSKVVKKIGDGVTIAIVDPDELAIPKHRFDAVVSERNRLREEIAARDQQFADLKSGVGDAAELKQQITDLQAKNRAATEAYEKQIREQRFSFALERAAATAQARNVKAVVALMDTSKISLDGDDLIGVETQIAAIKRSDPYLFGVELWGQGPEGTGKPPRVALNPWKKETFNLTKQGEILRSDPDLAAKLKREAGK